MFSGRDLHFLYAARAQVAMVLYHERVTAPGGCKGVSLAHLHATMPARDAFSMIAIISSEVV
jgi:hypothetical protein